MFFQSTNRYYCLKGLSDSSIGQRPLLLLAFKRTKINVLHLDPKEIRKTISPPCQTPKKGTFGSEGPKTQDTGSVPLGHFEMLDTSRQGGGGGDTLFFSLYTFIAKTRCINLIYISTGQGLFLNLFVKDQGVIVNFIYLLL